MPTRKPPRPRASTSPVNARSKRGRYVVGFFHEVLVHTKGEWAGQPFRLLPWQIQVIDTLFGTERPDGRRQYRRAYIEVPKKNGKSALAAGFALYLLLGEDEPSAEIYSVAVDREQARIVFAQAREMVEASPEMSKLVRIYKNAIERKDHSGSYRVLSADVPTKHGINASGIIIDELHAFKTRDLWSVLQGSTAARREPLTIEITTAGVDRTSVCWEEHDYAVRVRDRVIENPEFLPVIYAASPEDDWTDPATWAKANPSLGVSVREEFLWQECQRARQSPMYENTFKRFHLNLWTEQIARWLPIEPWNACAVHVPDAELLGAPAFAGLDLGYADDFSAFVIVFQLPDGRVAVRTRYWLPDAAVARYPSRPYIVWQRQGLLTVTPGNSTELDTVEADVLAACRQYAVREVAYDARFATGMAQHLTNAGLLMIDQPQGFALNEALRKLLELVHSGRLAHGGDPILSWMAANMTVRAGNRGEVRADKDKAGEKIDGIVALAMALDRRLRWQEEETAYADHGLLTV